MLVLGASPFESLDFIFFGCPPSLSPTCKHHRRQCLLFLVTRTCRSAVVGLLQGVQTRANSRCSGVGGRRTGRVRGSLCLSIDGGDFEGCRCRWFAEANFGGDLPGFISSIGVFHRPSLSGANRGSMEH